LSALDEREKEKHRWHVVGKKQMLKAIVCKVPLSHLRTSVWGCQQKRCVCVFKDAAPLL